METNADAMRTRQYATQVLTSDNSGNIVHKITDQALFGPPGVGYTWTFAVSCVNAPIGGSFQGFVSDLLWANWLANAPSQLIQMTMQEHFNISATGLAANTQYQFNLVGYIEPDNEAILLFPQSGTVDVAGITNVTVIANTRTVGTASYTLGSGTVTLPGFLPQDQYISLVPASTNANATGIVSVIGGTSGIIYIANELLCNGNAQIGQGRVSFPFFGSIDTSLIIKTTGTGSYGVVALGSPVPIPPQLLPTNIATLSSAASGSSFGLQPSPLTNLNRYIRVLGGYVGAGTTANVAFIQGLDPFYGTGQTDFRKIGFSLTETAVGAIQWGFVIPKGVYLQGTVAAGITVISSGGTVEATLLYQHIAMP